MLLSNPRNIEIRGKIQTDIAHRVRAIAANAEQQKRLGISKNSINYIDETLPSSLKIILMELNKKVKHWKNKKTNPQQLANLLELFQRNERDCKRIPEFHIGYGRLLNEMNAFSRAIKQFEKALQLNPNLIIAKYFLVISYFLQYNANKSA